MKRISSLTYVGALTFILAAVWGLAHWTGVGAQPEADAAVTLDDERHFLSLYRDYERSIFDALVTGDVSNFPDIFYNDPTVEIVPEHAELVERYRAEVDAVLASAQSGPVGAKTGFLSASIAEMLAVDEQARAWEAVKAQAAARGTQASIADLPEGFQPIERKQPDEWIHVDVHIHNLRIQGEHAWATFTYGTDRLEGNFLHLTFTRVAGTWYISSAWGEGNA